MIRGYFRLEPGKNNAQEKISALIEAGATSGNIFFEIAGYKELNRLLGTLRKGDMLVVPQVTDIFHNKAALSDLIEKLEKKGAALRSLDEPWLNFNTRDKTNSAVSLPAVEDQPATGEQVQERRDDARAAGRPKGPRREIMQKLGFAFRMYHTAGHLSVSEICKTVKLNERTFYRHLERQGIQIIRRPKGRKPKGCAKN